MTISSTTGGLFTAGAVLIVLSAALVMSTLRGEPQYPAAYMRPAACAIVRQHAPDRILNDAPDKCLVRIDKMLENVVVSDAVQVSATELIALVKVK